MFSKKIVSIVLLASIFSCGVVKKSHAEVNWWHVGLAGAAGATVSAVGSMWLTKRIIERSMQQRLAQAQAQQNALFIEKHEKTFDDFIGQDRVVQRVNKFMKLLEAKRCKGLIIEGAKGNGKTLLAHIIANKLDSALLAVSGYDFLGKSPEECEEFLWNLLALALEKSKEKFTVLFIDDLDVLFQGANYFAQRLLRGLATYFNDIGDDEKFLLMGAITNASIMDERMLQRAGIERIKILLPDKMSRKAILKNYLEKIKLDPELLVADVDQKWSQKFFGYGVSAEFLKNFVKQAELRALSDTSTFVMEKHFDDVFYTLECGVEHNESRTEDELWKTSIHEAGHALVAVLLGQRVFLASILHRERCVGVVFHKVSHEFWTYRTAKDLENLIMIKLGSFCAEKLLFGAVAPIVQRDLSQANAIANDMVSLCGMGGIPAGLIREHITSDAMKEKFDVAMADILQKCMTEVEILLQANQEKLEALAQALLEKKTLLEKEIYAITGEPLSS